jgi:hypothetical protein
MPTTPSPLDTWRASHLARAIATLEHTLRRYGALDELDPVRRTLRGIACPDRPCQDFATGKTSQCPAQAQPGGAYCPEHTRP